MVDVIQCFFEFCKNLTFSMYDLATSFEQTFGEI